VDAGVVDEPVELGWSARFSAWLASGALALLATLVMSKTLPPAAFLGVAVMILAAFVGELLCQLFRRKVPAVCWVSLVAMFLTSPWCPLAPQITAAHNAVGIMALITPMLAFAGLSIAKDIPAFRRLGWRIVVVSLIASFGTFIGAAFIAEVFH